MILLSKIANQICRKPNIGLAKKKKAKWIFDWINQKMLHVVAFSRMEKMVGL
jgi:hypothetical protein